MNSKLKEARKRWEEIYNKQQDAIANQKTSIDRLLMMNTSGSAALMEIANGGLTESQAANRAQRALDEMEHARTEWRPPTDKASDPVVQTSY